MDYVRFLIYLYNNSPSGNILCCFAKKMARKNVHQLCRNKITRIFAPSLPTLREADTETDNSHTNNNFKFTTMAYVISDDCIACGTCIDECPAGAISEGAKYSINPDVCVDCGTCADVCPTGAIAPGE